MKALSQHKNRLTPQEQVLLVGAERPGAQAEPGGLGDMLGYDVLPLQVSEVFSWMQLHKPLALIIHLDRDIEGTLELLRHLHNTWPGVPAVLVVDIEPSIFEGMGVPFVRRADGLRGLAQQTRSVIKSFQGGRTLLLGLLMGYIRFGYSGLAHIVAEYDYGKVGFSEGRLVHAETRELQGSDALASILTWRKAKISGLHPVHSKKTLEPQEAEQLICLSFDIDAEPMAVAVCTDQPQPVQEATAAQEVEHDPWSLEKALFDTLLEFDVDPFSFEPVSADEAMEANIVEDGSGGFVPESVEFGEFVLVKGEVLEVAEVSSLPSPHPQSVDVSLPDPGETPGPVAGHDNEEEMSQNISETLQKLQSLSGYVGVALVDSNSGMMLGHDGGGAINLEIAAAANSEVVKAKRQAIKMLKLKEDIEDILITLDGQYHLIRPFKQRPSIFFYLVLDRSRSNLALARMELGDVEGSLEL
jgi:predicted regulator of Ras-like GTPase activity (Roadblock/LC7/MglB family)